MIQSKEDYKRYLEADKKALSKTALFPFIVGDEIWIFQRLMRKIEYYTNCKGLIFIPYLYFMKFRYRLMSIRLGYSIPINTCGEGLRLAHIGNVIINKKARIGNNCTIHVGVNIGEYKGEYPQIGNNVYIAPGVKIYGGVKIADRIMIGANAVVNKSFETPGIKIAGVPAKVI